MLSIEGNDAGGIGYRISTGSWNGVGEAVLEGAADGYMSGAISGFITGGLTSNVCFVAGTSVLTLFGYTAIENIKTEDYVWAYNPKSRYVTIKKVVETFVNYTTELIHI